MDAVEPSDSNTDAIKTIITFIIKNPSKDYLLGK